MSKAFNHAQAKAYQDERRQREQDELHKKHVRAELQVLGRFRDYMQRERPTATTLGCLIGAVDAYAEQLTGSPTRCGLDLVTLRTGGMSKRLRQKLSPCESRGGPTSRLNDEGRVAGAVFVSA